MSSGRIFARRRDLNGEGRASDTACGTWPTANKRPTKSAGSRLERRERGCDACVARVAMDGYPGLARSRDSVAQCPQGEAQERRVRRSFQADDELRRVRAPIDRDDVGARVRRADLVWIVSDDGRDRGHEILAEITACVAGNRIGHFADEILDVLIAGIG